ncbi:ABC transporter substrate-binding protein [Chelativorans sp. YIM 93263]|uniref:ABC transporter substrate-binding protein n=1 Tax=Chelativorans sp. YIM 93263 TaxID=2906648 RepID=UPI002379722D|nr:iron-siderophore ABC transporter substrate-binding protein [Chelativorans sp. YIM 93263]
MKPFKTIAAAAGFLLAGGAAQAAEVTHAMGTTDVPDDPQRVVILTNEGTEAVLTLGVQPVGAANSWTGDPWYDHIEDEMGDATPVGKESAVNLELIAALQPDLILGNKTRHEAIYPQLSAIAATVFSERLRGDWRKNFALYAEALGRQEEGEKVLAEFDADVEELAAKLGDATEEKVSVIRMTAGQIRIYQKDSFSGYMLEHIGFQRPANQDVDEFVMRVGKESIPDMDGDRIFYFTYDTGDGEGEKLTEEVINDPLWKSLDAVKAGKVHVVDDTIWNTAGGIIAARLMLEDVARIYGVSE